MIGVPYRLAVEHGEWFVALVMATVTERYGGKFVWSNLQEAWLHTTPCVSGQIRTQEKDG